jgi:hypothetical protein
MIWKRLFGAASRYSRDFILGCSQGCGRISPTPRSLTKVSRFRMETSVAHWLLTLVEAVATEPDNQLDTVVVL